MLCSNKESLRNPLNEKESKRGASNGGSPRRTDIMNCAPLRHEVSPRSWFECRKAAYRSCAPWHDHGRIASSIGNNINMVIQEHDAQIFC
jgi:hypothetical protein